jgi:hypothetical protein
MRKAGQREPARFNVFGPDGMMVHDGGSCEYTAVRAAELAALAPGRSVTPASGQAAQVDAAIRLAAAFVKVRDCDYQRVEGDPAIRVCLAHNPDFGLYDDEVCVQGGGRPS